MSRAWKLSMVATLLVGTTLVPARGDALELSQEAFTLGIPGQESDEFGRLSHQCGTGSTQPRHQSPQEEPTENARAAKWELATNRIHALQTALRVLAFVRLTP